MCESMSVYVCVCVCLCGCLCGCVCKISNFVLRTLTEVVHLPLSLPVVSDLPSGSK